MKSKPESSLEKEVVKAFEAGGVVEYLEYLQSGRRIMWINFKAGVARGLGVTVGMTVVVGLIVWVLTMLVGIPLIGQYFADARQYVTEYAENTNYKANFEEMNELLEEIKQNTAKESQNKEQSLQE